MNGSAQLLIPIGTVLAVVVTAIGAALWITRELASLRLELATMRAEIQVELTRLKTDIQAGANKTARVEEGGESYWTLAEMQLWAVNLKTLNPTLAIPDVRDIVTLRRH